MADIDHWHPILDSKRLKKKPVLVRLCGRDIVLFRTADKKIGALDNVCPHRRMSLCLGTIEKDRLRCKYHGWTFDTDGNGESPGNPKLYAQAQPYDVQERFGAVWVKARGANAQFPKFEVEGYYHLCTLFHQAKAPLEVTVDNFCEIEHTPTTHAVFGFELERMHEVSVEFEPTDTTVRVINRGPPKRLNWFMRLLLGIKKDYIFNDDWTTHFSPVYTVYDHWWSCPKTGRQGMVGWRLFIFCSPIDDNNTAVTTLAFTKSRYPGPAGGVRLFRWLLIPKLAHEIDLDVQILENLADKNPSIEGMKLSRFDRVLGLNRERIERIYRGKR